VKRMRCLGEETYSFHPVREARLEGRRDRRARSRGLGKVRGDGQERGQGQWTELGIGI